MRFVKMHGLGNDYVFVDAARERIDDAPALARAVSDRHFGLGGDGLILVLPPDDPHAAHARMRMFNADGSESEMCGNGLRCVAKFVVDHGIADANPLRLETGAGVLEVTWTRGDDGHVSEVTVDMGPASFRADAIDAVLPGVAGEVELVAHDLDPVRVFGIEPTLAAGIEPVGSGVSMGNPHLVLWCDDVASKPLERIGPLLETHAAFPRRLNVHLVERLAPDEVRMRTWERGSGITLACGTGASAVCAAGAREGRTMDSVLAHLPGGDLRLRYDPSTTHVFMTGPATHVFEGTFDPDALMRGWRVAQGEEAHDS